MKLDDLKIFKYTYKKKKYDYDLEILKNDFCE